MRYRDLVLVICLVALGAAWWQTKPEPSSMALAAPSPAPSLAVVSPQASPTAPLAQSSPQAKTSPESKRDAFQRIPSPQLSLELKDSSEEFFELVLQARLKTSRDMVVPMLDRNTPRTSLSILVGERNWDFQYPDVSQAPKRVLQKGEELSWEIPLRHLVFPKENQELASLYGKEPLKFSLMLVEGSEDPNPYSRRLMMIVHGELTLTP